MSTAIQLNSGEVIVTIVRRHWFHLAIEAAVDIFIFTGVFVTISVADAVLLGGSGVFSTQKSLSLSLFLLALVALLLWMRFFAAWSDHWLDAWVITDKRVIDIEQKGFFTREVSSFPLDRIQDVTFEVSGAIAMWLHFGDIRMRTASITDDLTMRQVPFPEDVKEHLMSVLPNNTKGV